MERKITIIDYGLGNLASVANALARLKIPYEISSNPSVIKKADGLILPGDGAAGQAMENLKKNGLDVSIKTAIANGTPFLGICIGMQILLSYSEENETQCLDIVAGKVKRLQTKLKIPEIGWNQVEIQNSNSKTQKYNSKFKSILKDIPDQNYFYFINSFVCVPDDKSIVAGVTEYGETFCSIFEKENIFGVQFHPEKSGDAGLQMLKNFWEVVCK